MVVISVGWFSAGFTVARQRYRGRCLRPCDDDCPADCHLAHEPRWRR